MSAPARSLRPSWREAAADAAIQVTHPIRPAVSAEPGAVLAYTRADGWHLIPSARTQALAEALGRRATFTQPAAHRAGPRTEPGPTLPGLADLSRWVDRVNAHLAAEQGYGGAS